MLLQRIGEKEGNEFYRLLTWVASLCVQGLHSGGLLKLHPTCAGRLRVCDVTLDGPLCRATASNCAPLPTTPLSDVLQAFKLTVILLLPRQPCPLSTQLSSIRAAGMIFT